MPSFESAQLSREQILRAQEARSPKLPEQNMTGELCLFGGTAMVPAFNARVSTNDVNALFRPAPVISDAARRAGEAHAER